MVAILLLVSYAIGLLSGVGLMRNTLKDALKESKVSFYFIDTPVKTDPIVNTTSEVFVKGTIVTGICFSEKGSKLLNSLYGGSTGEKTSF